MKLSCKISPASKRLNYLLQMKKGAKWAKLRTINKSGSFTGTSKLTVKQLFGSKAIKVGKYRVKISADSNSVTRSFSVKAASSSGGDGTGGGGSGGSDDGATVVRPTAGHWAAAGNTIDFYVSADQANVVQLVFRYSVSCSEGGTMSGTTTFMTSDAITALAFGRSGSSLSYSGVFDSATAAHGTIRLAGSDYYCGAYDTGTLGWSASLVDGSQLQAPSGFTKLSPANGAVVPLDVYDPVDFTWAGSSYSLFYEYCADATNNNSCDLDNWSLTTELTGWDIFFEGLTYYWQVRAMNALGTVEADGGAWFSFTVPLSSG